MYLRTCRCVKRRNGNFGPQVANPQIEKTMVRKSQIATFA
jgi:hypothetical protein